jgi:hypothetical protein
MDESIRTAAISPLCQRLIDDMNMRRFSRETQRNYIRDVGRFATFLRRSSDTATADDVRRLQIEQRDGGVPTRGFHRIRHYGLLASSAHMASLKDSSGQPPLGCACIICQKDQRPLQPENR